MNRTAPGTAQRG